MKNKYLAPRQRVVELNEFEMLCTSEPVKSSMRVDLNDYDTYEPNEGNDTGSDF